MDERLCGYRLHRNLLRFGDRTIECASFDDEEVLHAIAAEEANYERRNPYFGRVWPAAIGLAEELFARGRLDGKSVLDLGCGPGLTGIAAAHLGASVCFADVMTEAIALARHNCAVEGVTGRFVELDLRDADRFGETFDVVLASDLLYEKWKAAALASALAHLVRPGGMAWASDPSRPGGDDFEAIARHGGFRCETRLHPVDQGGRSVSVRIFELHS